jgi:hypothetical protein
MRLTLVDPTGFHAWDKVYLDVDEGQEIVTIQSIAASNILVTPTKIHGGMGAYPVIVDGGVAQARNLLRTIDKLTTKIGDSGDTAGIKRVEEIEFFQARNGSSSVFQDVKAQREDARKELAEVLGLVYMRGSRRGSGGHRAEVY